MVLTEMGRFAAAEERLAAADEKAAAIADENERAAMQITVADERAYFYRLRGNVAGAKAVFGALVAKGPPTAAAYVRYAKFLMKLGQSDEALAQVERGIAVEPGSVEARRVLCEIWFARGEASPVLVNQVQEVARMAPKDPVVDYLRGKLSALQGDLKVGVDLLTRFASAAPDDPDAHYALGAVLAKSGEFASAVKELERAGELMPGSPDVRVAMAKVRQAWAFEMLRRGRVIEAQATLRRAAADDPSSRDVRALLADSLRYTGQVDLSEKEVRGLLHADPNDKAALRMLAAIHVQNGQLDDATVVLRHLAEVAPEDWSAWSFLSSVLADKGDLDAAEVAAKSARTAAPDEPGALAALLHVLAKRDGGRAAAEREIEAAAAKHPEESQYPYFLAILREQEGRFEEAAAAAAKSLDLRPSNPAALELAIAALSTGLKDSERAAAFARERVAKARDDRMMAYQLAQIESQTGHRDAALAVLKPICEEDMPLFPALTLRGLLLIEAHDWPAARAALTKGIEQYADGVDLHYLLAQSWLQDPASSRDGEPQDPARGFAIAELRTVVKIVTNHTTALNNLAWLLSRDEATRAEALQLADTAVRQLPSNPDYLDTLGTVLMRLGRAADAVEVFRRALGVCEDARKALDKAPAGKLSTAETARRDSQQRRLAAATAAIRLHHDEALKASGGR
jgi:Flp pilus assembly protein TadD